MRAQKGNLEKICHPARARSHTFFPSFPSFLAFPSPVACGLSFSRRRMGPRMGPRASIGEPLCSNSISSACASFRATSRVSDIRLRHSLGDPQMARGTSLGQQLFVQPRLATRSLMATSIRRLSFAACLVHPGWWAVSARSVSPVIFARPDSISALLPRRREGPSGFFLPPDAFFDIFFWSHHAGGQSHLGHDRRLRLFLPTFRLVFDRKRKPQDDSWGPLEGAASNIPGRILRHVFVRAFPCWNRRNPL